MKDSLTQRLRDAVALVALAAIGAATAVRPAVAQQKQQPNGGRYEVLVLNLVPQNGANKDFGKKAADAMKKLIDNMDRYQPVSENDVKNAAHKYKLHADRLTCIQGRQLAVTKGWELVMCGSYTAQNQVKARFVSSKTGDTFDVAAFPATTPQQASKHIFDKFRNYVNQLSMTAYCLEYLDSHQYASALQNCDQALAINPKSVSANYGRARALMQMDSLPGALTALQTVLKERPTDQDALLTAGIVATKLNQQTQARQYFRNYLQLNPGNVDVRLKVATDMANAGDPAGAYKLASEGLTTDSANLTLEEYTGHFALAAAQAAEQQPADGEGVDSARVRQLYNAALSNYRKVFAAKGDSADSQMLRNMIVVLTKLGQNDQAAQLGQKIVAVKPNDADLWMTYASALNQDGRLQDAITAINKAVSINPNLPDALGMEGQWLLQAGKLDQAKQVFDQALSRTTDPTKKAELSDRFANSVFATGYNNKYKKGEKTAAIQYFRLAQQYATSRQTKAMVAFWSGYPLYEQAVEIQKANTVKSAKQSLSMFQEALKDFEMSGPYAKTQKAVPLAKLINACKQYIQIQQLLIKRG